MRRESADNADRASSDASLSLDAAVISVTPRTLSPYLELKASAISRAVIPSDATLSASNVMTHWKGVEPLILTLSTPFSADS